MHTDDPRIRETVTPELLARASAAGFQIMRAMRKFTLRLRHAFLWQLKIYER
jgi:hypothetical protein